MLTKLWNRLDQDFLDFNLGGSLLGIKNRALMGCMSHNATGKTIKGLTIFIFSPLFKHGVQPIRAGIAFPIFDKTKYQACKVLCCVNSECRNNICFQMHSLYREFIKG